jgi:hypothetical protein
MIAERKIDGTSIGIVVSNGRVRLEFWAEVNELVKLPEHLAWTRCTGVADDDERPPLRREVELWASQNAGVVQQMIELARENRAVPTEEEKKRSERFRYWVNAWARAFAFNQLLGGKTASRAMVLLSASGGVALFFIPNDPAYRAVRLIALALGVVSAIALVPVGIQWLLTRVWRRFRRL